eukprot:5160773-Amphidinium_carterae.1
MKAAEKGEDTPSPLPAHKHTCSQRARAQTSASNKPMTHTRGSGVGWTPTRCRDSKAGAKGTLHTTSVK